MMYLGAGLSLVASVALLAIITYSRDISSEWAVWVFVGLGMVLFVGGAVYEQWYKRKHGDESVSKYREIVERG